MKFNSQNIYIVIFICVLFTVYQIHCLMHDEVDMLKSKYDPVILV
jgi:hypothetical protein